MEIDGVDYAIVIEVPIAARSDIGEIVVLDNRVIINRNAAHAIDVARDQVRHNLDIVVPYTLGPQDWLSWRADGVDVDKLHRRHQPEARDIAR